MWVEVSISMLSLNTGRSVIETFRAILRTKKQGPAYGGALKNVAAAWRLPTASIFTQERKIQSSA
jgi:hypothetical protein